MLSGGHYGERAHVGNEVEAAAVYVAEQDGQAGRNAFHCQRENRPRQVEKYYKVEGMEKKMEELLSILRELHPEVDYGTEGHLVDGMILDSFDIVTLISEIQEVFDVTIDAKRIIPENFNSAKALYALIEELKDED